jgi:hypothetical protein
VATTFVSPAILVVLFVVHHRQYVENAPAVVYAADQSESVVTHVEHNAVSDLISRAKRLFHLTEMTPPRQAGQLVPGAQVSFGISPIDFSRLPELDESRF